MTLAKDLYYFDRYSDKGTRRSRLRVPPEQRSWSLA